MSEHHEHTHEHANHAHHAAETPVVTAPLYNIRELKFSFKKQVLKDADGNPIKDELGVEKKRPPVVLNVKVPTFEGLLTEISDPNVANFVLDLVEEAIKDQVRQQLSDEENPVNRQEELDEKKLTLSYIANIPRSERTGSALSKEVFEDFGKDYIEVMQQFRAVEKVTHAAKLFMGKLNSVKTDKRILKLLREQLATWAENTKQLEDLQEVYVFLDNRISTFLKKDDVDQLALL